MSKNILHSKKCSKCGIIKSFAEYFKDRRRAVGIRCRCKACCTEDTIEWRVKNRSEYNNYAAAWRAKNPGKQHANDIKRNYGLDIASYNGMLADQRCLCKICGKQHEPTRSRGRLYVDHCHKTGVIRGLLCSSCNYALGKFKDDPTLLEKAAAYLRA